MRKKFIFSLVALLLLTGASASYATMYMDAKLDSLSSLYTLTTGSVANKVGDIYSGTATPNIVDIGYDGSNQKMYAISGNRLYTLDYANPVGGVVTATAVGTAHTSNRRGLEVIGGTIYTGTGITEIPAGSGSLYTLDPSTGAETLKGSFGTWGGDYIGQQGDLAYGNGKLYATMTWAGHSGYYLATIDTTLGTATQVGKILSGSSNPAIDGIVFINGTLYGTSRGTLATPAELYTINISDALATKVDTTTGVYTSFGLTQIPLPPTVLLLGSGLVGLGLLGWRRRKAS